jgi:hypothetical protein
MGHEIVKYFNALIIKASFGYAVFGPQSTPKSNIVKHLIEWQYQSPNRQSSLNGIGSERGIGEQAPRARSPVNSPRITEPNSHILTESIVRPYSNVDFSRNAVSPEQNRWAA